MIPIPDLVIIFSHLQEWCKRKLESLKSICDLWPQLIKPIGFWNYAAIPCTSVYVILGLMCSLGMTHCAQHPLWNWELGSRKVVVGRAEWPLWATHKLDLWERSDYEYAEEASWERKGRVRQEHRIRRQRWEGSAVQALLSLKLVIQLLPCTNFQ